jgi:hypothetical protein
MSAADWRRTTTPGISIGSLPPTTEWPDAVLVQSLPPILRILGVGPTRDHRGNHVDSGPAAILEEGGEGKRIALFRSVSDRVYLLSGTLSRDLAIATANAVE